MAASDKSFVFPEFWSYPPYFTLQPIPETRQKQKELWSSLILSYCRHHKIFQINVDDAAQQQSPPFANPAIKRTRCYFKNL
jgi:ESCRT-II complex subunit VPS25